MAFDDLPHQYNQSRDLWVCKGAVSELMTGIDQFDADGAGIDIAPARKDDPGELFPWKRLAEAGIGLWPAPGSDPGADAVPALLTRYGYDPEASPEKIVTAFQRHFRPSRVDGMADAETRAVLSGLLALYDA